MLKHFEYSPGRSGVCVDVSTDAEWLLIRRAEQRDQEKADIAVRLDDKQLKEVAF